MRRHLDFDKFLKESLKNPKIRAGFDRLQPEFEFINTLIQARAGSGLTQNRLAKKIGTKQSVISRLESGRANPSVAFLKKLAGALNSHLEIKFIPQD